MMTYSEPLGIIGLVGRENGLEGVVSGDDETSKVGKNLSSEVEENEEEVEADNTKDGVNLGDGCLLLEVVEDLVLGKLEKKDRISKYSRRSTRMCRFRPLRAMYNSWRQRLL